MRSISDDVDERTFPVLTSRHEQQRDEQGTPSSLDPLTRPCNAWSRQNEPKGIRSDAPSNLRSDRRNGVPQLLEPEGDDWDDESVPREVNQESYGDCEGDEGGRGP